MTSLESSPNIPSTSNKERVVFAQQVAGNAAADTVVGLFGGWDAYAENKVDIGANLGLFANLMGAIREKGEKWRDSMPMLEDFAGTQEQKRRLSIAADLYSEAATTGRNPTELEDYARHKYIVDREQPENDPDGAIAVLGSYTRAWNREQAAETQV
jgi:hypothetical protein